MAVFAIALTQPQPNQEVIELIKSEYPGHYEYNSTLYLIEDDTLAETVAVKVRIKGDDRIADASGFVLKLEDFSYSGYTTRSLWDWLKSVERRSWERIRAQAHKAGNSSRVPCHRGRR